MPERSPASKAAIHLVRFDAVDEVWPAVEPYLARIPKRVVNSSTPTDILEAVKDRRMMLWVIERDGTLIGAAATSEHTNVPEPYVFINSFAGDGVRGWVHDFLDDFEERARRAGMVRVRGGGRPGWIRELRHRGYYPLPGAQFEKRLV